MGMWIKKNTFIIIALQAILLAVAIVLCCNLRGKTQTVGLPDFSNSVVEVYASEGEEFSFGTAWFVADNYLVTNYHVISRKQYEDRVNFEKVQIRFGNEQEYTSVDIISWSEKDDIAILRYSGNNQL